MSNTEQKTVNYEDLDWSLPGVSWQPSRIQFNTKEEWRHFRNHYASVLNHRRDWNYNPQTMVFVQ